MIDARLEDWAQQLTDASPSLDSEGQHIARETYQLLAKGEPIIESDIATSTGIPRDRVEESLASWPLVLRDDQNRIIGFWGLHVEHIEPTHSMGVDGTDLYAWCAWDTLFITEILGRKIHVESSDPWDGTPVRLTVTPEAVTSLQPAEAVVSILLPEEGIGEDAIQRFCHKIHFFASPESAEAWMADRPGLFAINVNDAFELGRLTNRLRFGIGAPADDVAATAR